MQDKGEFVKVKDLRVMKRDPPERRASVFNAHLSRQNIEMKGRACRQENTFANVRIMRLIKR
jgi:hypothetical protein